MLLVVFSASICWAWGFRHPMRGAGSVAQRPMRTTSRADYDLCWTYALEGDGGRGGGDARWGGEGLNEAKRRGRATPRIVFHVNTSSEPKRVKQTQSLQSRRPPRAMQPGVMPHHRCRCHHRHCRCQGCLQHPVAPLAPPRPLYELRAQLRGEASVQTPAPRCPRLLPLPLPAGRPQPRRQQGPGKASVPPPWTRE